MALVALALGIPWQAVTALLERYLSPNDELAHPQALISGRDLIRELGVPSGPRIGELLSVVEKAQAEGTIASRDQALAWIKTVV